MKKFIVSFILIALSPLLFAQQPLNNASVIKLVKSGVSEDVILTAINYSPGTYDTTPEAIIELKTAGASDKVMATLVAKATTAQPTTPTTATVVAVTPSTGPAIVHFYRYKQYVGSALRPSVYCDSIPLGRVSNGRFFDVRIPAGEHTFNADDKQAGAMVNLQAGKEYFFRTDLQAGMWKGHFRLTMVQDEQGKYDLAKLKPADGDDTVHELTANSAVK